MIRRGDIWWASVDDTRGSDALRPVLVVSGDAFNRSQIPTVIALAISSDLRLIEAPGNVQLHMSESRLPTDSVINVAAITTLSKSDLDEWLVPRRRQRAAPDRGRPQARAPTRLGA